MEVITRGAVITEPGNSVENKTGTWRVFKPVRVELISPCTYNCPVHNKIPKIFEQIRNGKIEEAAKILLETNPFPSITGRVCPHFCEQKCNRGEYDEAISIREVERFIGDQILEKKSEFIKIPEETDKKIAIIGSGPAGLSAAYYLRKEGHRVTIFEREEKAGGLLTYGIPPYRLPKQIVEKEIDMLKKMGIEIKTNVKIGIDVKFDRIQKEFDAVLLATGLKERDIGIPGEENLISGLDFLKRVNEGLREPPGKDVAVIGGGNAAIDVARTLRRLGSNPVIIYRRTEREMPAISEEVEKAKEDGIEFEFLTQPIEASKKGDKIVLKCIRMKLGEPDETGRRKPIPIEGSEFTLEFDAVIKAVGEIPNIPWVPEKFLNKGWIKADPTGYVGENVFAAGDLVSGPATVVEAIASGRRAAKSINSYLKGERIEIEKPLEEAVEFNKINVAYYELEKRAKAHQLRPEERIKSFKEENLGIGIEDVKREAERCFSCGYCRACRICWTFCPEACIKLNSENKPEINYDYCKGCGICYNECPCGAIEFVKEEK